jgi:cell wall-associated NlpC family hydrolase
MPPVPAAAEPMLKQLISVSGTIAHENEQAAALSEQYDQGTIQLAAANERLARNDGLLQAAEQAFQRAKVELREAAIEAYVTGQTNAIDASLLANTLSNGSMVDVYGSVATGDLGHALAAFARATRAAKSLDDAARAAAKAKADDLSRIAALRKTATRLEARAASQLRSIKAELLALVGRKEYARLMSPMPAGSPYHGPDLAGSALGKVATTREARAAVAAAEKYLGVPYVWGGASKRGVDCSGLVMLAWGAAGIPLEHSATVQWEESKPVSLSHLEPGDLLFYHFADDGNTPITHVVMYVGSGPYGKATVIQAAMPGTDVSYAPIYFSGFVSAGLP